MRENIKQVFFGGALLALLAPAAAFAEDPYVIGVTADLTGPFASNGGPMVDALRVYFDRVNKNGGINGRTVTIEVRDNQSQGARARADAKAFAGDGNVILMVNSAASSTYAPVVKESHDAGIPVLFAAGVCPKEVFPPADPLLFCTSSFASEKDTEFAINYIAEVAADKNKVAAISAAVPVSRAGIDHGVALAGKMNLEIVAQENIPMGAASYAPFATKIKESGASWGLTWAPWNVQIKTFEALRQLGWDGKYLAAGLSAAEDEMGRLKDQRFMVFTSSSMFADDLPVHKEIVEAMGGKTNYPVSFFGEGWVAAQTIETALKKISGDPSREKMREALDTSSIDTQGLRGGPIVWSKDNHFREQIYYRVYGWDADENKPKIVKDWVKLEVN